jgi:Co/Zn/Cd efflux system component
VSISLLSRTAIVAAYLTALLLHGRADTVTGLLAVAIVAVWAAPLLRSTADGSAVSRRIPRASAGPGCRRG